jgi:histidinol-phosphate/aromatic aminotransferase/cobyric acid decarboxylase-like protein
MQEIELWRRDWASLNTQAYLAHYAPNFSSGNADYAAWAKQKRVVNSGKSWIKVGISNISVFEYPDQPNMVVVNFEQDYSSNNLANKMKKRQYWTKQKNNWKIIYEGAG